MRIQRVLATIVMGGCMIGMIFSEPLASDSARESAVAGSFYENNPSILRDVVLRYLAEGKPLPEPVRFLICPHAGLVFSGPVAAKGYATLDTDVKRVIIIGPSHYKAFSGVAVPKFSFYETPLGRVPVDRLAVDKLKKKSMVVEADGFDEPEHCIEVQLPFLQMRLSGFSIVPMICGSVDPKKVAEVLRPYIDGTTAVIVSSDLSHYQIQPVAKNIDGETISTILTENVTGKIDACGETPIRIIMHLAAMLNLKPVLVDARTSFDTAPQHCPESRVVGYASIAYLSEKGAKLVHVKEEQIGTQASLKDLPEGLKKVLLAMARQSLESSVKQELFIPQDTIPPALLDYSGCFVTLTVKGVLRGCIGDIEPIKPLYQAVIDNAKNAALSDPRFPQVTPAELAAINVEVSVLTPPQKLAVSGADDLLSRLVPGRDGVILTDGVHLSTFLPQVWEQLPDKVQFLEQLSLKARMPKDAWKRVEVKTYRVIHFSE